MDQKNSKNYKSNDTIITINTKNNNKNQILTNTKLEACESTFLNNKLKINNSNKSINKINTNKRNKRKQSPKLLNIKNGKKNHEKNNLIFSKIDNNSNKIFKQKNLQTNIYNIKIKGNKFIRTFSGCGHNRKCSLNSKGTFNTYETRSKKFMVRNNSKDNENYYGGNSLLSNDIDIINEFNITNTNTNLNNLSYKKNNKFNTIITMTNYQQNDKEKFTKKISKEQFKTDIKKESKNNDYKQNVIKPHHILKYKEEISIHENKEDIYQNEEKKYLNQHSPEIFKNKEGILTNNINSTIDENSSNNKKAIKIHIIESFKQKNKNKKDNLIYLRENPFEKKENRNNSVDDKNNKKQNINNLNKSDEIMDNYFSYNKMGDLISIENNKKIYKINNCFKQSLKKEKNSKQLRNSNKKNFNQIKKINNNLKNKKIINNIKEIKIDRNVKLFKKGTLNIRSISNNKNLKNGNDSYSKGEKTNKYNNYFSQNYSIMSNRIKLTLNVVNRKNNYNNMKYSLIRNVKNHLAEDKNFNNLLFILNILSNWGNKNQLGITAIEIFDINNQKIKIKECEVEGGNNIHIERIFNDKIYTINENDMWLTDINNSKDKNSLNIKIYFYINNYINLESINNINIWNYNGWELNKSIKKIEILSKDEEIIYQGIVPKGEYNLKYFHPYKIRINKKILQKRNQNKIYKNTHLLYNTYKYDVDPSFDLNSILINKKSKTKNEIKNPYYNLIKQSSLINKRKINRLNFVKIKSSRSCHKEKNNYYSFINNEFKKNRNFSASKNKKPIVNKIKTIKTLKNNSYILENKKTDTKSRGSCEIQKQKNKNNQEYQITSLKIEKNSSLKNIKSLDSFKKQKSNNFKTINDNNYNINTKNRISNFSTTNNTLSLNSKQSDNSKLKKFIYFRKIRINILTNYGNSFVVGLTGLNLIDKDNKIIDIESAETVGALPKDLKTIYFNPNEFRIFENLFNGINNTVDENLMWLTIINPIPFIEISFKEEMTLSKIEIWNFNEPLGLDKGAKDIEIIFDDNENKVYNILLWKNLGIDYYNYFQTINFDKNEEISNINYIKLNNISNKNKKLPIGFIFKIIFVKNFGDKEMISLKKFELYNEKNILLSNYFVIHDNYYDNYKNNNSCKSILKNSSSDYIKNYFYYHKLFDFRKDEDSICNNLLFLCFNEIVEIKYIKIENISNGKLKKTSTKYMQIYCDDILIFEGELKPKGENIILFDEKEIKKFNNVINLNQKPEKHKYIEKTKGEVFRLINVD